VTVGRMHAGTAGNVIPPAATLTGTIRSRDAQARETLKREVERVIVGTASAHGCTADVTVGTGYPATVNDPRATEIVSRTAVELLGEERFDPNEPPAMGGEDFAFYLQEVPGCFFRIGTCPADRDEYAGHHTPEYDFTDEAIRTGVRMFCALAVRCSDGAVGDGPGD